jgi:hypothetical protein
VLAPGLTTKFGVAWETKKEAGREGEIESWTARAPAAKAADVSVPLIVCIIINLCYMLKDEGFSMSM